MFKAQMMEMFGPERTVAAFGWADAELTTLSPDAPFAPWWASQREDLVSRLPEAFTQGSFPRSLPDQFKPDLSRFVLLEEIMYQLTHGPQGGMEMWSGDNLLGVLPAIEGGWGFTPEGQIRADDVLRWFRGWGQEMDSDLAGMVAGVQSVTGAPDVEIAPGVRLRIRPERDSEQANDASPALDSMPVGALASKRDWRAAARAVASEIPKAETIHAEGPGAFLFSNGEVGLWVEAHIVVTQHRIVWALPKSRRAGVVDLRFDQVVKYLDQEPGVVALTCRDPEYAAMLRDPGNPHGETDAVFRFDGHDARTSLDIRGAIETGVQARGKAQPGSLSEYL